MALEYVQAGKIIDTLLSQSKNADSENKVSLKSLIYAKDKKLNNVPILQVLVTETLKCKFLFVSDSES